MYLVLSALISSPCQSLIFQVTLYTALSQRIRIIFKDQMLTFYFFRKVHPLLASEFATAYHVSLVSLKNHKAQL